MIVLLILLRLVNRISKNSPVIEYLKARTHNNVYMKRFIYDITSKSMVTTEDKITAYETWLSLSHASYTLNRQTV